MTDHGEKGHPRSQKGPWLTELVEGDPLQVAGQELVPLVRVTSRVRRRASLYGDDVGGQGYGIVHMRPVAILERGQGGQFTHRQQQIQDETARAVGRLVLIALLIPLLVALLVYLSRRLSNRC